ncbi:MAG: hypothetical protein KDD37_10365 [Bdellovibrionales bacterium]|nr:hypothetical protein [Bdellovibrionales bacterium]
MKNNTKLTILSIVSISMIAAFQNCANDVGFKEVDKVNARGGEDLVWKTGESNTSAVTTDIKKIDWNKDGLDDVVFSYSGNANVSKVTEICLSVKSNKLQSKCYPLGEDSYIDEDGNTIYRDNISTKSLD